MIDQRLVRDNPEVIAQQLKRRGKSIDLTGLQLIARQQRGLEEERSTLQADGNRIGKEVGLKIKGGANPNGEEVAALRQQGNAIKQKVAVFEEEEKALSSQLRDQLLSLPNLPSPLCPDGKSEDDNVEVRRWGTPRIEEGLEEHWQIAQRLNLFDTERSVRIAQSRFVTLMGQGARLERALINFMLDLHTSKGYREVMPPVLVNTASLTGSGQLPKFAEESFRCADDDLWLTPTAEVPVTSLHRDEIIPADQLPLRYSAYSLVSVERRGVTDGIRAASSVFTNSTKSSCTGLCTPTNPKRHTNKSPPMPKRCCRPSTCPTGFWIYARVIWASRRSAPTTWKCGYQGLEPFVKSPAAAFAAISRPADLPSEPKTANKPSWFTP